MNVMIFVHAKVHSVQAKATRDAMKTSKNLKLANYDLQLRLANKKVSEGESELKAKASSVKKNVSVDFKLSRSNYFITLFHNFCICL
jgi:hypothetical protein